MNNKYKIGDKVKLLESSYGYYEGDIATIIEQSLANDNFYIIYVPNRKSESGLTPYVAYKYDMLEPYNRLEKLNRILDDGK